MNSLRVRIFLLFFILLVAVQSVTLFTIYRSMRDEVVRNIGNQLEVGRQVFLTQFESRRRYLSVYSRTIGKDFGLLETFYDDPKSLLFALNNNRQRVGADLAVVVDNQGTVRADTVRPEEAGHAFELFDATRNRNPTDSLFMSVHAHTYQIVAAPLLAPNRIGWVYLGFLVDDDLARQFEKITALKVSFVAADATRRWRMIGSSLPESEQSEFVRGYGGGVTAPLPQTLGGETYLSLGVPLSNDSGASVVAVLQRSEDAALADYRPWWRQILGVFLATLVLAIAGAWAVARSVVKPVRLLVEQTRAIAGGDHAQPISTRQRGEVGELVTAFNQMQQAISERETSIRFNAYHDALTGLVNRYRFEQLLEERIQAAKPLQQHLGVLIVNLDRFKDINETLGHQAGDRLLREVGSRLARAVHPDDVVARLGADEFAVLLSGLVVTGLQARLDGLYAAIMQPYHAEGVTLHISAGIGVVLFPEHGSDAIALLRHADSARFSAKEKRLRYSVYDGSQDRYSLLRLGLLAELQTAIERGDLVLHYQPKYDIAQREITSAEALIRWVHPVYGTIPPSEFIPMVEHTGNIQVVTNWALRSALRQVAAWHDAGHRLRVAVNVAAQDLRSSGFVAEVQHAIAETGARADMLIIEVTESSVMEDVDTSIAVLEQLRNAGVMIAIDDYGTGYSSMAQLKKLPVNELKIDQSFVLDVDANQDDEIIVRSTIELGHNMGLKVTAEGVETFRALKLLRDLQCDVIQGYYISPPLPAEQFSAWLAARGWSEALAGAAS
ncbi:MAG TPA: EAL domain-containing protein [Gammaproteobacteria bacterium]|nr:EAL domain-containing protein [Gammaproteobacteria bacterium]